MTKPQKDELTAPQRIAAFVGAVRKFMRDDATLNRLIAGVESSDRDIVQATLDALSQFNSELPPIRSYTFEEFLTNGWTSPLVRGAASYLLMSVSLLQTRNQLNFNSGGVAMSTSDKGPQLAAYADRLKMEWTDWARRMKMSLNVRAGLGFGGAPSVYSLINGLDEYLDGLP